ncbi:hypothetical protein [Chitiniphilus eburneus]|uniref:hypothetical protein n=1 Tax=Chitiniphilus eburneus TaxID=2571148 RepID=UPI0035CEDAC1
MSRPDFCPSRQDVELGFGDVMGTVECPDEAKARVLELFDTALCRGDARQAVDAIRATLDEFGWRWPWCEQWADEFAHMRQYPYMWKSPRPDDLATCVLLEHTLSSRIYAIGHIKQYRESLAYEPQRWRLEYSHIGCPVEVAISQAVGPARLDAAPPFFPGDRTRLRLVRVPRG